MMAPVPLFTGVVSAFMPVARILMLAGLCLLVMLIEGTQGAVPLQFLMFLAQALVFMALWLLVAALAARLLGRVSPRRTAVAVLALLAGGAVLTASVDLYRTPFRAGGLRAGLLELFE
jgi:hypothetical protein